MSNPLIPNEKDIMLEQYAKCLNSVEFSAPVKISPMMTFLKGLATHSKEKQEKTLLTGQEVARFS